MQLSDAIRNGARKRPQWSGQEFFAHEAGLVKSNVFGALLEAIVEGAGNSPQNLIRSILANDKMPNTGYAEIRRLGEDYPVFKRQLICHREG